jgi:serine/threonine protein kinase
MPFITMEYVSGEDLKSTIKRVGALNASKAIFIAKQICEGLAEAHRLAVIHRDLKPQNIMIDKQGNSHIMDFGIARSPMTEGLTTSGMMVGSPYYVSPEQVQGKEVDERSDIYSLGVILYEMVTGDPPFTGDIPIAVAYKHTTEKPKNPREVNDQVPEELGRVILKCLEKDKAKRYQSVQELHQELENIEKGILPAEKVRLLRRLSTLGELLKKPKLRKFLLPASAVIGLVAVVAIVWFKISTGQIQSLVKQYLQALNTNKLLAFYESNCSPQFYQSIKSQAKRVLESYDNIQSTASNIKIRFRGPNQADVSFSYIIIGVSKEAKKSLTLSEEGISRWTLERQGVSWKITDINSQPKAKK